MCLLGPAGVASTSTSEKWKEVKYAKTFDTHLVHRAVCGTRSGRVLCRQPNRCFVSRQAKSYRGGLPTILHDQHIALVDNSHKVYKLDQKGNAKAVDALKNRADRSADPKAASKGDVVVAKITGTMNDGVVTVETIEVQ